MVKLEQGDVITIIVTVLAVVVTGILNSLLNLLGPWVMVPVTIGGVGVILYVLQRGGWFTAMSSEKLLRHGTPVKPLSASPLVSVWVSQLGPQFEHPRTSRQVKY